MPIFLNSRYQFNVGYYDTAGRIYLDDREPFRFRSHPGNRFHTVTEGDTWWGLAATYFRGEPRACGRWWILCEYQPTPVIDPTIVLPPGTVVVIPSVDLVRMEALNAQQRRYH